MPVIPIKIKGKLRRVSHEKLRPFQGKLKEMSDESAEKLAKSILKHGWRFPIFVWQDKGVEWIHDGHGRLLILQHLIDSGYTIDDLPVVDIEAKDKKEAAELLLAVNSRYQHTTPDGLYEFMTEMDIDIDTLKDYDLPDIDLESFSAEFFDDIVPTEDEEEEYKTKFEIAVECKDEDDQKAVYNLLTKKGYKCRVLTL